MKNSCFNLLFITFIISTKFMNLWCLINQTCKRNKVVSKSYFVFTTICLSILRNLVLLLIINISFNITSFIKMYEIKSTRSGFCFLGSFIYNRGETGLSLLELNFGLYSKFSDHQNLLDLKSLIFGINSLYKTSSLLNCVIVLSCM